MNYFSLFNLDTQFELNLQALAVTYQKLQQLTHPDKYANAGESEKLRMVQKNAQVNDGYQVLKSPLLRAEHILELRGVELKHEQRTLQDTAFLMQQMEWREALEDTESMQDPISSLEDLDDEISANIKVRIVQLQAQLDAASQEQDLAAADEIRKLKFLYKLKDEISRKEDALTDI